jgi:putative ATP-dependent endonuclease of the OLD family
MANQNAADASTIRRLKIRGFRGCKELVWYPGPGLNVILGGGDVGKTTILDAISLLLNPTNNYLVTESDYFLRQVTAEFEIEAVFTFASEIPINRQAVMAWPWDWDGKELLLPVGGDDQPTMTLPFPKQTAYCVRVRANTDLELAYEVRQPDGDVANFSVSLRRSIGLVRLGGDDRNDRDLRLVQGSALSQLLGDKGIRTRLGQELSSAGVEEHLAEDSESELAKLKVKFLERALPSDLGLAITGAPGLSIGPLVGLTAKRDDTILPLSSWGAGTRRLAALTISDSLQDKLPITVIDEIERGLEPYRQRYLVQLLSFSGSQVFLTTHSAAAIAAATQAQLWYLDASGSSVRFL